MSRRSDLIGTVVCVFATGAMIGRGWYWVAVLFALPALLGAVPLWCHLPGAPRYDVQDEPGGDPEQHRAADAHLTNGGARRAHRGSGR
jgi:hypothetical protein